MTGTPLETLPRHMAFARSDGTRSTPWPTIRARSPAKEAVSDGTSSRDFPSPWCSCCAVTKSKSSPWLTLGDGRATGAPDSDLPSNFRMQRPALHAAAVPAR